MKIERVNIFTLEHNFRVGSIEIDGDRIKQIVFEEPQNSGGRDANSNAADRGYDEQNGDILYAVPGFIDMHLHGCLGKDVCDGSMHSLQDIAEYQLNSGITGFAPATLTLPVEELKHVLNTICNYVNREKICAVDDSPLAADILGINMEGPFISYKKRGAQDGRHILPADGQLVREFLNASGNLVKILGIAPEQNEETAILEILQAVAQGENLADADGKPLSRVHISLAHTDASYEQALRAFENGADHVTHLCNAMPVFHHRKPGVIGAALDACTADRAIEHGHGGSEVTVELICDGVHVHPAMVRAVFKMFDAEHIILVSDSMRGTGLPDGVYKLGNLDVEVCGNKAVLCRADSSSRSDGETERSGEGEPQEPPLAGSVTNLFQCFQTAVKQMKLPLSEVLTCVTENPAKKLSVFGERGSIEPGKMADILLLDKELNLKKVIKSGKVLMIK